MILLWCLSAGRIVAAGVGSLSYLRICLLTAFEGLWYWPNTTISNKFHRVSRPNWFLYEKVKTKNVDEMTYFYLSKFPRCVKSDWLSHWHFQQGSELFYICYWISVLKTFLYLLNLRLGILLNGVLGGFWSSWYFPKKVYPLQEGSLINQKVAERRFSDQAKPNEWANPARNWSQNPWINPLKSVIAWIGPPIYN